MTHVELSLTDPLLPQQSRPAQAVVGSLERWGGTCAQAAEPCLVLDKLSTIVAVSRAGCQLLGFPGPKLAIRRNLFAGVIQLLDFTSPAAALADGDLEKIPPVLACSSGRLARGLLRVRSSEHVLTLDAIATPLFDDGAVVGSLTFFAQI